MKSPISICYTRHISIHRLGTWMSMLIEKYASHFGFDWHVLLFSFIHWLFIVFVIVAVVVVFFFFFFYCSGSQKMYNSSKLAIVWRKSNKKKSNFELKASILIRSRIQMSLFFILVYIIHSERLRRWGARTSSKQSQRTFCYCLQYTAREYNRDNIFAINQFRMYDFGFSIWIHSIPFTELMHLRTRSEKVHQNETGSQLVC